MMHLDQKIAKILITRKLTIAAAESCTGGLLAHTLTNIPGSSAFFLLGITAYDNTAKIEILKLPPATIKKHGAVSAPVAKLMAQNIRKILKTDYGIGITGIAGPGGATANKPVGLVFIALCDSRKTIVEQFLFKGNRLQIKTQAVQAALRICWQKLAKD